MHVFLSGKNTKSPLKKKTEHAILSNAVWHQAQTEVVRRGYPADRCSSSADSWRREFNLEKGSKIHFRQGEEHMLFHSFEFKSHHIRNAFPDYNPNIIYIL